MIFQESLESFFKEYCHLCRISFFSLKWMPEVIFEYHFGKTFDFISDISTYGDAEITNISMKSLMMFLQWLTISKRAISCYRKDRETQLKTCTALLHLYANFLLFFLFL